MIPLLLAIAFVVVGTLVYVALRNAQDFSDANEIIPGVPTVAPKEWAGAHSPEARLHRRLRDAMEAVRANAALDDGSMASVRTSLEQAALATDERLIAAAALPKGHREEPVRRTTEAVEAIEGLVASLVELRGPAVEDAERRIDEVRQRVRFLAEAHEELAASDPTSADLTILRAQIEADAQAAGPVADPPESATADPDADGPRDTPAGPAGS
ncbi:MAG: hypothetical protein ACSLFO_08005 [Acidimicrobiales bacterium]